MKIRKAMMSGPNFYKYVVGDIELPPRFHREYMNEDFMYISKTYSKEYMNEVATDISYTFQRHTVRSI